MKHALLLMAVMWWCGCNTPNHALLQKDAVVLSAPKVIVDRPFFDSMTTLHVHPTALDAEIHYTVDGSEPTADSPVAGELLEVTSSGIYLFRAIGAGYMDSRCTEVEVVRCGSVLESMMTASGISEKYPGTASGLTDRIKASVDYKDAGWTGFDLGKTRISVDFYGERAVSSVVVSSLRSHDAWIFAPEYIKVDIEGTDGVMRHYDVRDTMVNVVDSENKLVYQTISFPAVDPSHISIDIVGPKTLPDWHSGGGGQPWLFLDEIVIF